MSTHDISSTAEAAREAHRDPSGKFGTQPAGEAIDVELNDALISEDARAELAEVAQSARDLSIDATTGASPGVVRNYAWHDDESGDFALWSEDLLNTPVEHLSDEALDDIRTTSQFVEEAASDPDNVTSEDVAQEAYDTYWGHNGASSDFAGSAEAPLWLALARTARGEQPDDEQKTMAAEVAAHEADGGIIEVDQHDGSVRWRAYAEPENSPLYRACKDPQGAPVAFDPDGTPRQWNRGVSVVRSIYDDGTDARFDPTTGNPAYESKPDGSFTHYDINASDWQVHRDPAEGPAKFDSDGAQWIRDDDMHRDPDEGPAFLGSDGHARFYQHGTEVAPTPEQLERRGLEAVMVPSPRGTIDPNYVRYQAKGSTVGEHFDYTGHPLDHGLRIKDNQ